MLNKIEQYFEYLYLKARKQNAQITELKKQVENWAKAGVKWFIWQIWFLRPYTSAAVIWNEDWLMVKLFKYDLENILMLLTDGNFVNQEQWGKLKHILRICKDDFCLKLRFMMHLLSLLGSWAILSWLVVRCFYVPSHL